MSRVTQVSLFLLLVFLSAGLRAQRAINLDEALEIAREHSPDIRLAKLNLERSRELLKAQEAGLKSRFSLTLRPFAFSRDREFNTFFSTWNTSEIKQSSGTFVVSQPLIWTDGTIALRNQFNWRDSFTEYQNVRSKTFSNNLFLAYDQPIFTYNRTALALRDVELDLENARLNYMLQELLLELNVARSFYTVYQDRMSLQVAKEELVNREKSFEIIKNKVDAGLSAREELLQAELDLTSSRSQVQNNEVALANALDEFKKQIGLPIEEDINVMAAIGEQPVSVDLQKALQEGLKNRIELRERKIDIETAKSNVVRSEATNEFKGNISLSYGIIGNDEEFTGIYNTPTRNQQASISFEVPIWDWGEQESRIRAAVASVRSSQLTLEEQKRDIIIGVRRAVRNLKNLEIQIELAKKNVEIAELTYEINLERYENGDLTSMDLNLFQNQLSQKKIGLIDALINYKIALLNLKIESLWDFEKNKSVINE